MEATLKAPMSRHGNDSKGISMNIKQTLVALALMTMTCSAWATPQTTYYVYDEAGHVIGEYDQNGNPVQEHIYLGDRPVAVAVTSSGSTTVDYVTTDQLNTPRAVTDSSKTIQWSWTSDPFGNGQSTGSLTYNLRFPGQYYDAETGHNYNDHRDYDPSSGRYIESDPIGLSGGLNTYNYAVSNPEEFVDPTGLCVSGVFPISFSVDTKYGSAGPGKWTMQTDDAEGGDAFNPWWSVRCWCWRQHNGIKTTTVRIKWRKVECLACNTPGNSYDFWGDPHSITTDVPNYDKHFFAFYTINGDFADQECEQKCDSLNLTQ